MSGPSHQKEQLDRLETLLNDRALIRKDTMQSRAIAEADDVQGRWAQQNKSAVTGQTPALWVRPVWSNPPGPGIEPPIDARECGTEFGVALGEAHEQPTSFSDPALSGQASQLGVAAGAVGEEAITSTVNHPVDDLSPRPTTNPTNRRRRMTCSD